VVGRQTGFRGSKSIAGAALVGLGAFILYENLAGAVVRLSQVLGANGSGALGVLPAVILAGSRVVQAYPAGHQRFLHAAARHGRDGIITGCVTSQERLWTRRSDRPSFDVKVEGYLKRNKETGQCDAS